MRDDVAALRSNFQSRRRMRKLVPAPNCQRCGISLTDAKSLGRGLDLHHIRSISDCVDAGVTDPDVVNINENLHTLCYWCHREWHTYWETFRPDYDKYFNATPFHTTLQTQT